MNKKVLVTLSVIFVVIVLALIFFLNRKVVVTFDTNGGSVINDVSVRVNTKVSRPVNPTKEGYEFVRWELDNKEYNFASKVTKNITLKAIWEKKSDSSIIYTITLDVYDKISNDSDIVVDGKITSLPSPSKEGYTFIGWYDGDTKVSVGDTITKDTTLVAKFEKENLDDDTKDNDNDKKDDNTTIKYTVTFDSDGGSKVNKQTVLKDDKASKPKDPTKSKYKFLGWYLNDEVYSFDTKVTKNITLKAKWEYIKELTYDIVEETGSIVGQARVFLYADGEKTTGYVDITTDSGKFTVEVPYAGYKINKDKVKKVDNLRLK